MQEILAVAKQENNFRRNYLVLDQPPGQSMFRPVPKGRWTTLRNWQGQVKERTLGGKAAAGWLCGNRYEDRCSFGGEIKDCLYADNQGRDRQGGFSEFY